MNFVVDYLCFHLVTQKMSKSTKVRAFDCNVYLMTFFHIMYYMIYVQ